MDSDGPVLPQDIITNILIRLPVKFLIRFQCVCKHWKNLLKTPSFIAEHLHYSSHENPCILLGDYDKSDSFRICLLDREMQVLELRNDAFIDPIRRPSILGSCNGLICLRLSTYRISLCILVWNPAVREARVTGALSYSENNDYRVGFGFSPTANDYKIVNIRVCSIVDLVNQVEVLTLSTGSWREVEFGSLDRVAVLSNGYNTDGAIFWDAVKLGVDEEGEDDVEVIVSFDIAMEVFTLIPIPSASSAISIAYENKLAMLSHDTRRDSQSSSIHLWVRDEEGTCASGEGCSWVKKCTSNPYLGSLLGPVTVWRNEIVCNLYPSCRPVENDERKIVLFNLTTNEFKTFYIRKSTLSYNIFNYAESLVPVGNIHIE